jgi:hypothetical protein
MAGQIGCGALQVSGGQAGDSVIRLTENIIEQSLLNQQETIVENITESVTVIVT